MVFKQTIEINITSLIYLHRICGLAITMIKNLEVKYFKVVRNATTKKFTDSKINYVIPIKNFI